MVKTAWYDIEMRGRRLEALSKRMTTEFYKLINDPTPDKIDLALSYWDRIIKTESVLHPYVEQMTGLKKFLSRNAKKNTIPA